MAHERNFAGFLHLLAVAPECSSLSPQLTKMLAEKSLLEKLGLKQQEEPREVVRKCQRMIRTEIRGVERQMMGAGRQRACCGRPEGRWRLPLALHATLSCWDGRHPAPAVPRPTAAPPPAACV